MPSSHVLGMDHARGKASTVQVLRQSKVTGSVLSPRTTVKRKAAVRPTRLPIAVPYAEATAATT